MKRKEDFCGFLGRLGPFLWRDGVWVGGEMQREGEREGILKSE